jgi:glycosyltransferase involved in cell wall biosynthesis
MRTIAVVIPVMNEEEIIASALEQINSFKPQPDEVIIVNNGSTDKTYQILNDLKSAYNNLKVHTLAFPSIGKAQKLGLKNAKSDLVVMFDADYIDEDFYGRAIKSKADVCVSSKRELGAEDSRSPVRRLSTFLFTKLSKIILNISISDTHGVKSFTKETIEKYIDNCGDASHVFDTELIARAEHGGAKIDVWPAKVKEVRPPRISIFKRAPIAIYELMRLRMRLNKR